MTKRTKNKDEPWVKPWVQYIVWPIVVLVALFVFREPIAKFIGDATDTNIKFNEHGFSIHAKRPSPGILLPEPAGKEGEGATPAPTPVITPAQAPSTPVVTAAQPAPTPTPAKWILDMPAPEWFRNMVAAIVNWFRGMVAAILEWFRYIRLDFIRPSSGPSIS